MTSDECESERQRASAMKQAYRADPDWLADQFRVPRLRDVAAQPEVAGVTRLLALPAFEPEAILTCELRGSVLRLSMVVGATSLAWSIPHIVRHGNLGGRLVGATLAPFDANEAKRVEAFLDIARAPPPFDDWHSVEAAAREAPSCANEYLDGISYRHEVVTRDGEIRSTWANPDETNSPQIELMIQYRELFQAAGITVPHQYLPRKGVWWRFWE